MPTRADMEAAVPKCPGTTTQVRMGQGHALKHHPCGAPMRWEYEPERWRCCTKDAHVLSGEDAAAHMHEEGVT